MDQGACVAAPKLFLIEEVETIDGKRVGGWGDGGNTRDFS